MRQAYCWAGLHAGLNQRALPTRSTGSRCRALQAKQGNMNTTNQLGGVHSTAFDLASWGSKVLLVLNHRLQPGLGPVDCSTMVLRPCINSADPSDLPAHPASYINMELQTVIRIGNVFINDAALIADALHGWPHCLTRTTRCLQCKSADAGHVLAQTRVKVTQGHIGLDIELYTPRQRLHSIRQATQINRLQRPVIKAPPTACLVISGPKSPAFQLHACSTCSSLHRPLVSPATHTRSLVGSVLVGSQPIGRSQMHLPLDEVKCTHMFHFLNYGINCQLKLPCTPAGRTSAASPALEVLYSEPVH